MDGAVHDQERNPYEVQITLTRRPKRRRRRFSFFGDRLKGVGGALDAPGMELAEVPIIGPIVLIIFFVIIAVVLGLLVGGILLAFIEVTILAVLALAGSLWAWLRGHPKVAVVDIGDQRWVRREGPAVGIIEDHRAIVAGADPVALGYEPTP